jgi:hypothetical protein
VNHLRWLCRVPQTIKEAKTLLEEIDEESFITESAPGGLVWPRLEASTVGLNSALGRGGEQNEPQKAQNQRLEKKLEILRNCASPNLAGKLARGFSVR